MKYIVLISLFITTLLQATSTPLYFCTACNSAYFDRLMNLVGSIHTTNYEDLDTIMVFNLGLTQQQIHLLNKIKKIKVCELEKNNPNITTSYRIDTKNKTVPSWFAFKDVALKQALELFPYVLWIDAGTTVLKPLRNLFKHIEQQGYFFCTVGACPVGWGSTKIVRDSFMLDLPENRWILDQDMVMGGAIGMKRNSIAHHKILMPMYEFAQDKEFLLYRDDGTTPNGFGTGRHDQPLRSALVYQAGLTVGTQDPTQKVPILLSVDGKEVPFYITWDKHKVCDKTEIFSSRAYFMKYQYFSSHIHYKTLRNNS